MLNPPPDHISHSIFHYGLIKLLVLNELTKKSWTWLHFLLWSGFEVEKPEIADEETDGKSKEKPPSTQKKVASQSRRLSQDSGKTPNHTKVIKERL